MTRIGIQFRFARAVVIVCIEDMTGEKHRHRIGIPDLEIDVFVVEIIKSVVVFLSLVHEVFPVHRPAMLVETVLDNALQ